MLDHSNKHCNLSHKSTDESDCPALLEKPKVGKNDVKNKGFLIPTKVCGSIISPECKKPQAIYANTAFKWNNKVANQRVKDSDSFKCSKSMFPDEGIIYIAVLESVNCDSHIENAYQGTRTTTLPDYVYIAVAYLELLFFAF